LKLASLTVRRSVQLLMLLARGDAAVAIGERVDVDQLAMNPAAQLEHLRFALVGWPSQG
jgi:hypothetical protein